MAGCVLGQVPLSLVMFITMGLKVDGVQDKMRGLAEQGRSSTTPPTPAAAGRGSGAGD